MSENIPKTIGLRLAAFRRSQEINPGDFCRSLEISRKRLTMIEEGTTDMPASLLIKIARLLKVPTTVLTGEERFEGYLEEGKS